MPDEAAHREASMIRRRSRRGPTKAAHPERLKLTSMMDILTVLLLFLLKSFVVDAEVVAPPPDVTLPGSSAETPPENSLVIAISNEMISLSGRDVTSVSDALAGMDLLIPALDAELENEYTRMAEIARRQGRDAPEGKITIQGDRALEFRLLQRVMYTCNFSGFDQLALAVVQEG
jgi:biopolymer transport protein ExbD